MKLSVRERLQILSLLPQQGDIRTVSLVKSIMDSLIFSEEEIAKMNLRQEGQTTLWDVGVEDKEVALGQPTKRLIREQLEEMDAEKRLTVEFIDLWNKFVKQRS